MHLITVHIGTETRTVTGKQPHAVIFGMNGLWVITAQCFDCSDPTVKPPPHSLVITPQSPAYPGSGFTAEKVAIDVRDRSGHRTHSSYVQAMHQAGVLDTSKDAQLDRELTRLLGVYWRSMMRA